MDHLLTVYQDYTTSINLTLALLSWEQIGQVVQVLHQIRRRHGTVFVMGSGTGATLASHLAQELDLQTSAAPSDLPQLRVMAVVDASPPYAVWGDSRSYDSAFLRIIGRMCADDVAIAFSTQGTSPEILSALRHARARGGFTIGLSDSRDSRMIDAVDLAVTVPNESMDQIEDVFQMLIHILAKALCSYSAHDQATLDKKWRIPEQMARRDPDRLIFHRQPRAKCSRRRPAS